MNHNQCLICGQLHKTEEHQCSICYLKGKNSHLESFCPDWSSTKQEINNCLYLCEICRKPCSSTRCASCSANVDYLLFDNRYLVP